MQRSVHKLNFLYYSIIICSVLAEQKLHSWKLLH